MLQLAPQSTEKPNEKTEQKVKNFLASIGVRYEAVKQLKDREGNLISAVAMADMLNKIISVVEGAADITTLPEEAAHFFVEMLGTDSPLYQQMYKQITGYKLYSDVVETYKGSKLYRNKDGTINFDKLKREAMGKLIMSYIISQERGEENPVKMMQAQSWWKKVWDFITRVFNSAPKRDGVIENPFAQAASQILKGDNTGLSEANMGDDIFLQQFENPGEALHSRILREQDRIKLDNDIDPRTGKPKHVYTKDGQPIVDKDGNPRSVNENVVKPWYQRMFPIDARDEVQKEIDELYAEYGTDLHSLIDQIVERYVDPSTGLRRKTPEPLKKNGFNSSVNGKLDDYILTLLNTYPEGTRFMTEVRLFNSKRNLPGTTDLLAIQKDGTVDVYDWKSQQVSKDQTEIKWFKEPAYRMQLNEYTRALSEEYGVLKFGKVRAIPIRTEFNVINYMGKWRPSSLKDIEIGPVDPSFIPDSKNYLMPVVAKDESTGDIVLDNLVKKLYATYDLLYQKSTKDKEKKNEELNKLMRTIRNLQVKKSLDNFVDTGNANISKYEEKIGELTINDIMEAIEIIKVYSDSTEAVVEQVKLMKKELEKETDPNRIDYLERKQLEYSNMALYAGSMREKLERRAMELAENHASTNGIRGLLNPERVMDYMKRNFKGLSSLDTVAAQLLNRMLVKARDNRDREIDEKFDKLSKLRDNLMKWANSKGLPIERMFEGILDGTDFLHLYSEEFREQRRQAMKKSDYAWLKENLEYTDAMRQKYQEDFKKYMDAILSDKYSSDPNEDKQIKEKKIIRWIEMNNPDESKTAWLNKKNRYLKPKDVWWSDKYKNLLKPENAPLKEAYDYFQSLLRDSQFAGMIDYEFGFIPSVHKTKLEAMVFGDHSLLGKSDNFLSGITVEDSNMFGKINPLTGEPILDIPVYYTRDLGKDKSLDLFKVFGVWSAHTANYKAMSSVEETAKVLMFVERNKGSLETNTYGNVKAGAEPLKTNTINASILEKHINYHIYGRKIELSEDKIIEVFGKKISLTRGLQKAMHYYSMNVLALNPVSGSAALFGGSVNAFFQAGKNKYFNNSDWGSAIKDFSTKDEKSHAFLDYISPELEDQTYRRSRQLSVSKAVQKINAEDLFIIQRGSDQLVTYPVTIAMYRSHMLDENNRIVYIPDYVKSKNNYEQFYSLPESERKALQKKMSQEIEELQKTKSLRALSKVVDDKLVIEGIERGSDEMMQFRAKIRKVVKTIIGNTTTEDINAFRIGIMGQAFSQFRSWIPSMVTERFGDLSYDGELETYTYGKARLFLKHLIDKRALPLIKELILGVGNDTIARAKERYQEMLVRKAMEGDLNFKDRMSEAQFIDMYIGNLRSAMRELAVIMLFMLLLTWLSGDDDDEPKTGTEKFFNRLLDKYFNELMFFYSPSETKQLIKSPLPLMGLLDNMFNFFSHSFGQVMGFTIQDEEVMNKNVPAKYFMKAFPVVKVTADYTAMFSDTFRKEFNFK